MEELLQSSSYLNALFETLPRVEALKKREELLILSNEDLASVYYTCSLFYLFTYFICYLERNLDLGQSLVNLRKETQQNFDDALSVQNQFSLIEKQLKDLDQVSLHPFLLLFI